MKLIKNNFKDAVLQLIKYTSTDISKDVENAIVEARNTEDSDSVAQKTLDQILDNIQQARVEAKPICQDTGTCNFYVTMPMNISQNKIKKIIISAVKEATEKSYLRPNSVNSITGKNSGNNIGVMSPYFSFEEWDKDKIEVRLMLKGGGSENVSTQYKLPNASLNAARDLDGVYKCVIDAVFQAQGLGCAPGIIGVGIGGDRATGMLLAKKQLFRFLDDKNSNDKLDTLEKKLYKDINTLEIGPMGFGGKTTLLGVKAGAAHRLPASFFVSIAYMCWAMRRQTLSFEEGGYNFEDF